MNVSELNGSVPSIRLYWILAFPSIVVTFVLALLVRLLLRFDFYHTASESIGAIKSPFAIRTKRRFDSMSNFKTRRPTQVETCKHVTGRCLQWKEQTILPTHPVDINPLNNSSNCEKNIRQNQHTFSGIPV